MPYYSSNAIEGRLLKPKIAFRKKKRLIRLSSQRLEVFENNSKEEPISVYDVLGWDVSFSEHLLTIKLSADGKLVMTLQASTYNEYTLWLGRLFKACGARDLEYFYELKEILGEGAFAIVKLAIERGTEEQCAVKVIDKNKAEKLNSKEALNRELDIMIKLCSIPRPHGGRPIPIIEMREIYDLSDRVYIVMEYMQGGTLEDAMMRMALRTERQVRTTMSEIVAAVEKLHSMKIVHRDLKLKNILCTNANFPLEVKIADFGLSNYVRDGSVALKSHVGSPHYVAPEVLKKDCKYGPEVDLWSCGVVLHLMFTGRYPFDGGTIKEILECVARGDFKMDSPAWKLVSEEGKEFLRKLLTVDIRQRMTATDALNHCWMTSDRLTRRS
ncbi:hypothetical protein NDN08_008227 [Rhodosorus marinus]|uniref:Protein kinase domain-containing protein n=1 Tax=Rhodosorus marinus TaxID=101924 RepID=A0AAV8V3A3_9RHOD|nr:hypothetical protein NDN08_008227 [Rhodosorus marinus]